MSNADSQGGTQGVAGSVGPLNAGPETGSRSMPDDAMQLLASMVDATKTIPGRRSFFVYRDLGVEKASRGRMRANIVSSVEGMLESTGWHYHVCDMQFVYILRGRVDIEFENGTVATFGPGDAMFIPGGTRHNEIFVSEDKVSLEVCLPARMETVPCERPAGLTAQLERVWNQGPVGDLRS